ncbi:unnamed protein product [Schistocephalus solidus]|uniref:C2H2-type domain-containing protein n=1 Tax=Schistocephalus solidus TaxID=70667 RepID=A0A183T0D0_SCHSO|nr:unnamed protein product [Schistocephalus solidus]
MDGQLINQRRMHSQSRVSTATIHELLFADDCALSATTERDIQKTINLFAAASDNFGLIINTENTGVMHEPPPNTACNATSITSNGAQIDAVDLPGEATSPEALKSIMRAQTESPKPAKNSYACTTSSGIDTVSTSAASSRRKNIAHDVDHPRHEYPTFSCPTSLDHQHHPPSRNSTAATLRSGNTALPSIHITAHFSPPETSTTASTTTVPSISDGVSDLNCPHCDHTCTSRIGLIGHLRIHCAETSKPVP